MTTVKYFKLMYGGTASIRLNKDGSATLKACDANGKFFYGKCYGSERAAKVALGKLTDGYEEIKR